MKAVQFVNMNNKKYLLHNDVLKIGDNEYLCKCCGCRWIGSITSPVLVDNEIKVLEYYNKEEITNCK